MKNICEVEEIAHLATQIKNEYTADIIVYHGPVDEDGYLALETLVSHKSNENLILILATFGGSAAYAYKIATFLQYSYSHIVVFVPVYCKSAGTILVLGAHELMMGPGGELGPIDPQGLQPNELCVSMPGLAVHSALDAAGDIASEFLLRSIDRVRLASNASISFEIAAAVFSGLATEMVRGVASRIDPIVLGRFHRNIEACRQYGTRLASRSGNASPETVQKLVVDYPDHGFVIDHVEAQELFHIVNAPSPELSTLAVILMDIISSEEVVITMLQLPDEKEQDQTEPDRDPLFEEAPTFH